MALFNKNTVLIVLGLMLGGFLGQLQAEEFRYLYVDLSDKVPPPPSNVLFSFFEAKSINDRGQVSGDIVSLCEIPCETTVGIYQNGKTQALQPGITFPIGPINQRGNVGGSVIIIPDPFIPITQAAIFNKAGLVIIPPAPLPTEFSGVLALNDKNVALVGFFDAVTFNLNSQALYANGKSNLIDFGQGITTPFTLRTNNKGIISGTNERTSDNAKAFRFNPQTGLLEVFDPLPGDEKTWGLGINDKGNVLGYSFVNGERKRIGFWDLSGQFHTYFVEGTPEFPTVSNRLVFNDKNQIVISAISEPDNEIGNSYFVPKPGVRLNIADLVVNKNELPLALRTSEILSINNHGDMVGSYITNDFIFSTFMLQRLDEDEVTAPEKSQARPVAKSVRTDFLPTAKQSMIRAFYRKKFNEMPQKDSLR